MGDITYLNFDVQISRDLGGGYSMVADSPGGETVRAAFDFPFSALELENFLLKAGPSRRGVRRIESQEIQAARTFGQRLYSALFTPEVRGALQSSLDEARRRAEESGARTGVRIRLKLGGAPELSNVPWEYLYNPALNRFFVLSAETPLVRYLELPERIRPLKVSTPLRILAIIASPREYMPLDVEREWHNLNEALEDLQRDGRVVLEQLEAPTLQALQRQLRRGEYHIFHFIGHGTFDPQSEDGLLAMEEEDGRGRLVSGQDLAVLLHDHPSLRLAVLNACEGGRTADSDPFAGAAQSLVQGGLPAVIAMQFEITDQAAVTFAHEFYRAMADGYPVDAALAEARKVVFTESRGSGLEWGTPVLFMRSSDGQIFTVERGRAVPTESHAPAPVLPPPAPAERVQPVEAPAPEPQPEHTPASISMRTPEQTPTTTRKAAPTAKAAGGRSPLILGGVGVLLLLVVAAVAWWLLAGRGALGSPQPQGNEEAANAAIDRGMTAMENSDYAKAAVEFSEAIRLKPDSAKAYQKRGDAYWSQELYDKAIEDYTQAIKFAPNDTSPFLARASAYVAKGDTGTALAEFTEATKRFPASYEVYDARGRFYFDTARYDEAIQDFTKVTSLSPADATGYDRRAQCYAAKGDYDAALADYNRALAISPDSDVFMHRGDTYMAMGRTDDAIADYRKVIEITDSDYQREEASKRLAVLGITVNITPTP